MLDLFLVYAPIVRPVALMLVPGLLAWLAWVIARRSGLQGATEPPAHPTPSRAKARSYPNP